MIPKKEVTVENLLKVLKRLPKKAVIYTKTLAQTGNLGILHRGEFYGLIELHNGKCEFDKCDLLD